MRHKQILPVLLTVFAFVLTMAPAAGAQGPPAFALPSWTDVSWRDPGYNLTIHTADVDGDGNADLFGRSPTQIEVYSMNTQIGQWIPITPITAPAAPSDAGGWNKPEYYSTLQGADLDADGRDELFIRSAAGIETFGYDPTTKKWDDSLPLLDDYTDDGQWWHPEYYSTIQAADLDGQPGDEIFGRGAGGIMAYKYDTGSQQWKLLPLLTDMSDGADWDHVEYYSTIQAADVDGLPGEEIIGRGRDAILVFKYDPNAQAWDELASISGPSDVNGWNDPKYYSTIQPANLDGQPGDEIIGRGYQGIDAWRYDRGTGAWDTLPDLEGADAPSDHAGWGKPEYYSTMHAGDIDGDGADEVIARSAGGIISWKFAGGQWSGMQGAATDFCDDPCGWQLDYHYPTLQLAHTGVSNRDQLIGRGTTGVVTYGYDSGTWAPVSAGFPQFTGNQQAAYADINQQLAGPFNSNFDIRQGYLTASPGTLQGWASALAGNMTPSPGIDPQAFAQVKQQLAQEARNAWQVATWYDGTSGYLPGFVKELDLGELMDNTAEVLNYDTQSQAELELQEMEVVEGILEGLNAFDAVAEPELSEAMVVANSLIGGGFTAALGVDGVDSAITDEVQGTYVRIQQQLENDYNSSLSGLDDAAQLIQSDYGLQSAVGGLVYSNAWKQLSPSDQKTAVAGGEHNYAVGVWQTILPEIWVGYRIPDSLYDNWCVNSGCDWEDPGGDWWSMSLSRSFGNCNTMTASLGPCQRAPLNRISQLFGQTSSTCTGTWNASCNLGVSYSDVFLGQNGWENLPAYTCADTHWFGTMNCSSVRSGDPGAGRPEAARLNLGGNTLDIAGAHWIGCSAMSRCLGMASAGSAAPAGRAAIRGAHAPAGSAIYRTAWSGRSGKSGTEAFRFDIPVAANGTYRLRLHFAETRRMAVGDRRFDVNVEGGGKELSGFDVRAEAGGRNQALVREFRVPVQDGKVTISFLRRAGAPMVSGVELVPVNGNASTPAAGRLRLKASGGRRLKLSGRLRADGPQRRRLIAIELRRRGGGDFRTAATVRTRPNGTFSLRLERPKRAVKVRASFAGDGAARPAVSKALSVRGAAAGGGAPR